MTASGVMWDMLTAPALALTPKQRWAAARSLGGGGADGLWDGLFLALAIAALIVLLLLLWHVSTRRKAPTRRLSRELFAENALQRTRASNPAGHCHAQRPGSKP
jgi:hypothetical protein